MAKHKGKVYIFVHKSENLCKFAIIKGKKKSEKLHNGKSIHKTVPRIDAG